MQWNFDLVKTSSKTKLPARRDWADAWNMTERDYTPGYYMLVLKHTKPTSSLHGTTLHALLKLWQELCLESIFLPPEFLKQNKMLGYIIPRAFPGSTVTNHQPPRKLPPQVLVSTGGWLQHGRGDWPRLVCWNLLSQWPNFKLFGITYLVGKISGSNFFFRVHWLTEEMFFF